MRTNAIPPVLADRSGTQEDLDAIDLALVDMRSFPRLWMDGTPVSPSTLPVPRSLDPYRVLAAVRLHGLTVSLDATEDEGRSLCIGYPENPVGSHSRTDVLTRPS